jgi:hypothetical protein
MTIVVEKVGYLKLKTLFTIGVIVYSLFLLLPRQIPIPYFILLSLLLGARVSECWHSYRADKWYNSDSTGGEEF